MFPETRISSLLRILQRYPAANRPDPAQPPTSPASGFSGAGVWRIETPAGPCALRAMPAGNVDVRRLAELHRLLAHLRNSGFLEMPVPIPSETGETFIRSGDEFWQLEPWMPGTAGYSLRPSAARLAAAMACLARWHAAASRFVPSGTGSAWFFNSASRPSPGIAERYAETARWDTRLCDRVREQLDRSPWTEFASLGREILSRFQQLAPRISMLLAPALHTAVPLQPCLRDVWHDHVLFTGDEVTGLIDPHAARSDCVATDLARLLGSLAGDDRRTWDVGLGAYQAVRPLSIDELALVELFDQSSVLLSGLTWLDWCCLQQRSFANREQVVSRLQAIVGRMEHLAQR
ncbi:MAG: phosphotransferase [Planctomycetia bacterium]|nr:phosphotransferase [Planctomycetia bacterium]